MYSLHSYWSNYRCFFWMTVNLLTGMSSNKLSAVLEKKIHHLCLNDFPCGYGSWVSFFSCNWLQCCLDYLKNNHVKPLIWSTVTTAYRNLGLAHSRVSINTMLLFSEKDQRQGRDSKNRGDRHTTGSTELPSFPMAAWWIVEPSSSSPETAQGGTWTSPPACWLHLQLLYYTSYRGQGRKYNSLLSYIWMFGLSYSLALFTGF